MLKLQWFFLLLSSSDPTYVAYVVVQSEPLNVCKNFNGNVMMNEAILTTINGAVVKQNFILSSSQASLQGRLVVHVVHVAY